MKKLAGLAVVVCAMALSPSVRADDKTASLTRTIVLHDFTVYGRALRPLAVTDTGKLPVKLTLTTLAQPLLDRIEPPVHAAPF
jgi:hypothetical protein